MWPRERQAIHLQNLREHVEQTTPKVRRPRSKRWQALGKIAGDLFIFAAVLIGGTVLLHQLYERG